MDKWWDLSSEAGPPLSPQRGAPSHRLGRSRPSLSRCGQVPPTANSAWVVLAGMFVVTARGKAIR